MTRVVNIRGRHHASVHPHYDVSIMRPGPFGNPFRIGYDGTRSQVIAEFEIYARDRIKKDAKWREMVRALSGKTLGCCCKPLDCHGDVLVRIVEELNSHAS